MMGPLEKSAKLVPHLPKALVDELIRLLKNTPENLNEYVRGGDDDIPDDELDRYIAEYEVLRSTLLETLTKLQELSQ